MGEFHQVIAECPVCKKKFRSGGEGEEWILRQTALVVGEGKILPSLPEFVCLGCGVVFFTKDSVKRAKENYARNNHQIIVPKLVGDIKIN